MKKVVSGVYVDFCQ